MRVASLLALFLAVLAAPASAQWERVDPNFPITDLWAVNLVAGDATYVYATALAGSPVPDRFLIFRSADDGASWAEVFSGYNGGARGVGLAESDGQWLLLVRGSGETAVLRSDDGAAWAETAARIPVGTSTSVAKLDDTYVVVGSDPSYRSTDGGATWTTFGDDQPMGTVRSFAGGFYALDGIGQLFRLDGDAWTAVPFGSAFATSYAVEGDRLWVKGTVASLHASTDGTTWAAQPTDEPTAWNGLFTTLEADTPWFMPGSQRVFVSTDDGATATDVTGDYPDAGNGFLCPGNHGASATAAYGNVVCGSGPRPSGLYRYLFSGGTAAASGPDADGLALRIDGTPTRGTARVRLELAEADVATVDVFDVQGRRMARLAEGPHPAGTSAFAVPGGLAQGVYVVRAVVGGRAVRALLTVVR